MQLDWRLVGTGLNNPQICARDPQGGVLRINKVTSRDGPDKWWLSGPYYGAATKHDSEDEAKSVAQHWADTDERPDSVNSQQP